MAKFTREHCVVNDVEHALSQIADIRARVIASTRFRGMPPKATLLSALAALVVATAQTLWPQLFPQDPLGYVVLWGVVILGCLWITGTETIARSRAAHGSMADAVLRDGLRHALPFAAAGLILDVVIYGFARESLWLLPGLWLILTALFGFSVLSRLPRAIVWVAVWFLASGSIVLVLAGASGELSPWMMGLPLGIGQTAVAFILHQANGEES